MPFVGVRLNDFFEAAEAAGELKVRHLRGF
jgi:hypothetical protein